MERSLATTWMPCALGLAVAGWTAVRTPRVGVSIAEHQANLGRPFVGWRQPQ
jgi:hypothetical protein